MICETLDRFVETEIVYALRSGDYMVDKKGSEIEYQRSKVVHYDGYDEEGRVSLTIRVVGGQVLVSYESAVIKGSLIRYSYYVDNQPLLNPHLVRDIMEILNA